MVPAIEVVAGDIGRVRNSQMLIALKGVVILNAPSNTQYLRSLFAAGQRTEGCRSVELA